jgi:hypothetical protein
MKVLSTMLQVESEFYLIDMNFVLIFPWGEFSQGFWEVYLLCKISPEFNSSRVFSVFSLSTLFVSWRDFYQRFWAFPLLWKTSEPTLGFVSLYSPFSPSLHHLSKTFSLRALPGPHSSKYKYLDLIFSSPRGDHPRPLQNWALPNSMDTRQKNHNETRITNSQYLLVGQDQYDEEIECAGSQRLRIHMGAFRSTLTFKLETLSQHRHLIERLQDKIFAQRSQIEE